MKIEPVRVGLIGCGEIAALATVPAIARTKWAKVVATMDTKLSLAKSLAAETGAETYTDSADALIKNPDVEAVVISTPHFLHVPLGIQAAKRKKHVMVEKPIATTMNDARRLMRACKTNRVTLSVAYIMRMGGAGRKAAELIKKGVLGRFTGFSLISMVHKKDSYWSGGYSGRVKTDWRTRRETAGGGFLIMNFTHNIDMIQSMLNLEPKSVFAQYDTFRTKVEVEDYVSVVVRYKNGAIGTFLGSTICPGRLSVPDHIYGTHGTIVLGNPLRVFTTKKIRGLKPNEWNEMKMPKDNPRAALMENFAKAIRGKAKPAITGESACTSLRVIEAAYKSQALGRPVVFR